jgi:hypothetical protein
MSANDPKQTSQLPSSVVGFNKRPMCALRDHYAAARVHHTSRRRGDCVAARSMGAAVSGSKTYRSNSKSALATSPKISTKIAATRLRRRQKSHYRIPLWRRQGRPVSFVCGGISDNAGRGNRSLGKPSCICRQTRYDQYSHFNWIRWRCCQYGPHFKYRSP